MSHGSRDLGLRGTLRGRFWCCELRAIFSYADFMLCCSAAGPGIYVFATNAVFLSLNYPS